MKTLLPQNFIIDPKKYRVIDKLSTGACFNTLLVEDDQSKKYIAVEATKSNLFSLNEIQKIVMLQHISILTPIGFSNVNFQQQDLPIVLFNYMPNGSLSSFLESNTIERISGSDRFNILIGIAFAVRYLHHLDDFIYMFLHPDNIFLDENLYPHLLYLGPTSIPKEELIEAYLSSNPKLPLYLAPEILEHKPFKRKVDIYSFSLIMYRIISGYVPYSNIIRKGVNHFIKKVTNNHRPSLKGLPNGKVPYILENCWRKDFNQRIGFKDVIDLMVTSPFFRYLEIEYSPVAEYLQKFGQEGNVPLRILQINIAELSEQDFETIYARIGRSKEEALNADAYIMGHIDNMPDIDEGKSFDTFVEESMSANGENRRTNQVLVYILNKNNMFTIENLLAIMSFNIKKEDDENNNDDNDKKEPPNTSIQY